MIIAEVLEGETGCLTRDLLNISGGRNMNTSQIHEMKEKIDAVKHIFYILLIQKQSFIRVS